MTNDTMNVIESLVPLVIPLGLIFGLMAVTVGVRALFFWWYRRTVSASD